MPEIRLADGKDIEPEVEEFLMVEMVSSIKNKWGFFHTVKYRFIIQTPVLLPLGDQGDGVSPFHRLVGIFNKFDPAGSPFPVFQIPAGIIQGMRIGDGQPGFFRKKLFANSDGWGFPRIPGIRFEGKPKNRDFFVHKCPEHGL